jgi:hypothetical protein
MRQGGIVADVGAMEYSPDGVTWQDIDGKVLEGLSTDFLPEQKKRLCLPLNKLMVTTKEYLHRQADVHIY